MRGRIEVVDHRPNKVQVVKSVKEIGKLINLAATPAPKKVRYIEEFSKKLNYEQHYGNKPYSIKQQEMAKNFVQGAINPDAT